LFLDDLTGSRGEAEERPGAPEVAYQFPRVLLRGLQKAFKRPLKGLLKAPLKAFKRALKGL
jgi:hypothetical protein